MSDKWHIEYAKNNGYEINKRVEHLILNGFKNKQDKFGERYCPCKIDNIPENICPCLELRTTNHCHCGLFISVPKYNSEGES